MKIGMTDKKAFFALACVAAALSSSAEVVQGDITAMVRADMNLPETSATPASYEASVGASALFDGNLSDAASSLDGKVTQRYLVSRTSLSSQDFIVNYALHDEFYPGKSVVVTGISFEVGGAYEGSDKEKRTIWGSSFDRLPTSFYIEGSNDGESWSNIVSLSAGAWTNTYHYVKHTHSESGVAYNDYVIGTVDFCNWTSYRKYRIVMTGSRFKDAGASNDFYYQISEIMLHGLVGDVVRPDPEKIDITSSVRAAGKQTVEVNAGTATADSQYSHSHIADGTFNNNRYLSSATTTKGLLEAGNPVTIDYSIADDGTFACGADVIVTAYTIDVDSTFASAMARLPRDWELQGWNGDSWDTIDRMSGFYDWETVERSDNSSTRNHYSFTFSITNSVSYRKYRLSVTEVVDRANSGNYFQISEFQLWGYVDVGIEGKVGLTAEPHAIVITEKAYHSSYNKAGFVPSVSVSAYDDTEGTKEGSYTYLFDRNYLNRFLVRLGVDGDERAYFPFTVTYGIPDTYLPNRDIVLTGYSIFSRTNFGQYDKRMPLTWKVQGLAPDGRWITVDRRTDFTAWQTDSENNLYYATFEIPENDIAFRSYRLYITDVSGVSDFGGRSEMRQIQLAEIELRGKWGVGISQPVPQKIGMTVIIK